MNKEFVYRQIVLLEKNLSHDPKSMRDLHILMNQLEGLCSALKKEGLSFDWIEKIENKCGIFEEIYAVNLDEGISTLSKEDFELINPTILCLKILVKSVKSSFELFSHT
ncbi:hypothetical protein EB093_08270 [bacterium]|nr:hypothetical protein [bacterium]